MKASQAIPLHLKSRLETAVNNRDRIERVLKYGTDLELQIMAIPGEPLAGGKGYTDGINKWYDLRLPRNDGKDPFINWPIGEKTRLIGASGWDYVNQVSRWVGFDFDSKIGHASDVGLSNEDLEQVKANGAIVPFLETRNSTGGIGGLHFYATLAEPLVARNRAEHRQNAFLVLAEASKFCGFNFQEYVDCVGGMLWFDSIKQNPQSFKLLSAATEAFEMPTSWTPSAVSRPPISIPQPQSVSDDIFDKLAQPFPPVELDDQHKQLRAKLGELGCSNWDTANRLLRTHTVLLKAAHTELNLRGTFETTSPGTRTHDANCFAYPMPGGAWRVFRFSGAAEHPSWTHEGGKVSCVFNPVEPKADGYDSQVRCLKNVGGNPEGWAILNKAGEWEAKNRSSIRPVLISFGCSKSESDSVIGHLERDSWTVESVPFAPEYPGGRRWNRKAAQLTCKPVKGSHPHWDLILDHVGNSLDAHLTGTEFATGREYLQAWFASVIRHPFQPLPYLFVCGPENSGKSILHEAFRLLVTSGVERADRALTADFNGELEGCVVAVVEEKDMSESKIRDKIKDYVCGQTIAIRRMRTDVYQVANSTHWIQCANDKAYCPIFAGDTRVTALYVPGQREKFQRLSYCNALRMRHQRFYTHC